MLASNDITHHFQYSGLDEILLMNTICSKIQRLVTKVSNDIMTSEKVAYLEHINDMTKFQLYTEFIERIKSNPKELHLFLGGRYNG